MGSCWVNGELLGSPAPQYHSTAATCFTTRKPAEPKINYPALRSAEYPTCNYRLIEARNLRQKGNLEKKEWEKIDTRNKKA